MDNFAEEALKKIDELLMKQEDEKGKLMNEIRSELLKLNASAGEDKAAEKIQMTNEEDEKKVMAGYENIDAESESEPEIVPEPYEPMLIAVMGAKSRVGTTHCAVEIANYFMRRDKRTAVMEFNDSGGFSAMGRYFSQESEEFFYKDVKYYARCTLQLLDMAASSGKYDFLILDLGNYSEEKTLFLRSDVKFIVSSGKPWELESLFIIFREINKNVLLQTNFIFNFVPESGKEAIIAGMEELGRVYFSSYIENPYEEVDGNIEGILKEYIEKPEIPEEDINERTKKASLFRRHKHEKNEEQRKRKKDFVQAVSATE